LATVAEPCNVDGKFGLNGRTLANAVKVGPLKSDSSPIVTLADILDALRFTVRVTGGPGGSGSHVKDFVSVIGVVFTQLKVTGAALAVEQNSASKNVALIKLDRNFMGHNLFLKLFSRNDLFRPCRKAKIMLETISS
jgi:hypothetical protein